ncbi:dihydrolipoamide acetyltransferase family protein [Aestuariivita boseongensis]|uniref:dihydrolipoamide acetyltransferase family protein n=1 Tax=Aestuariivita boseongensis TaxID=1470562 RepID=UPI000680C703|nr:dihydrolipoamide acetyltransferase family protein [Aestuariivita boseongensis]
MAVFTLPSLGSDMEAGTLVEWLVSPGDTVRRGDVIAIIETQKGAIEIECYEQGTVHALLCETGTELPVGAPLAVILAPGEMPPDDLSLPAQEIETSEPRRAEQAHAKAPATPPPSGNGVRASPAARLRAREKNVDLRTLSGSFPGGEIILADVEAAGQKSVEKTEKNSRIDEMRKAIAASMTRSKQTIPHFYLSQTIDVEPAMTWLREYNQTVPPSERLLIGALFVRCAAMAAEKVPEMNGHCTDGVFHPSEEVNAAVAVALRGGGLVAPALMDAHRMDLHQTMTGMRDIVSRARAGRLRNSEMTQGTITISSLGDTGADAMVGVIFPPQVALLCLGAPTVRPWVLGGKIVPRHVVTVTVSADHRVSDGRRAAQFIAEFEARMKDPEHL